MPALATPGTVCVACDTPLGADGGCVACLLRAGLVEADQPGTPDTVFGDFEIDRADDGSLCELGRGAMGVTYRATDNVLHRIVALKVIEPPASPTDSQAVRERFLREARAAAALRHPNVAGVFHFGTSAEVDRCYCAMELVEGETLEARVRREGPLTVELALDIAIQITRALIAAAERGLVHRDLKPGNIMLACDSETRGMQVKVIDFGLAKAASAAGDMELTHGGFVGTPAFASPEQFVGGTIDARSDIYALGVTLWFALTGRLPFGGSSIEQIRRRQADRALPIEQLRAKRVPRRVIDLLRSCLAIEPDRRPASAGELMQALKSCRTPRPHRLRRRNIAIVAITALLCLAAAILFWRSQTEDHPARSGQSEKSIAVLPFQDLSNNRDNAAFGAGIQDDVLTSLAQIHDLKVISRTSVMAYEKPDGRDMGAIGRALGVANILEGSVRREGNRVLVNVQLIDARTDRHLWAERYDRTGADAIGLQGELATQIAAALKATLAPEEKARLGVEPTTNSEAYVLYLSALGKQTTDEIAAEQLCVQATTLDPKFALAYARASLLNSGIADQQQSRTRRVKARAQAEEALRLSPNLGEAHAALALCLYWGEKKYPAALKEFEIAAAISPNDAEIHRHVGGIYRRQGRWREAVASFDRALSLDPRNTRVLFSAANNHLFMRDWAGAVAGYNQVLKVSPDAVLARVALAYLEVCRNSNPAAGRKILENIPANQTALTTWNLTMLERDYTGAEQALRNFNPDDFAWGYPSKEFCAGLIALARGDLESAQRSFVTATPTFEDRVREDPHDPLRHGELGLLYAYLQRKEDAIRESRRAVELDPESEDAFHGALQAANLALVYALVGDQEEAITLLERLLSTPGAVSFPGCPQSITLAELRLGSQWDSLRSNPRFQKILAASEPKTVY